MKPSEMHKVFTMKMEAVVGCDPCALALYKKRLEENLPKGMVLVVDELGMASYMRMMPDGHLGAVGE